jgi:long-chain acyl-CoA synthetase
LSFIETPWEGANTMASLFELAYQQYWGNHLLGTRELIKQETELSKDGKAFEKLTLGNYEWVSYGQALQHITNFASGLVGIGDQKGERVAIFSETSRMDDCSPGIPSFFNVSWCFRCQL